MHRSGTSLAARVLQLLGVSLGDERLLAEPGADNPAGYWENRLVRELDDLVLAALGGSWDQPPALEPGWEHAHQLDGLRVEAAAILDTTFGPVGERPALFGWKDPRLCLLVPFWETVLPIDVSIVVVRDPAQVADSLHVRNGFSAPHGAALWLRYLLAATDDQRCHVLVDHDALVNDLGPTMRHLAEALSLAAPSAEVIAAGEAHLDPSLQHHQRRTADAGGGEHDENPVVCLAGRMFNGGKLDVGSLDPVVADAIRYGWLRPSADAEQLAGARARAVELEEHLRRQKRRWDAERRARGVTA